jgi:hypothetical protein
MAACVVVAGAVLFGGAWLYTVIVNALHKKAALSAPVEA